MAAPLTATTLDMSGTYILNKKQSDSMDKLLELAGVGWLVRKAVGHATPTLTIKHTSESGVEVIHVDSMVAAGKGRSESKDIDGVEVAREDPIFGPSLTAIKRVPPAELSAAFPFLREGWTADSLENGLVMNIMKAESGKDGGWHSEAVWGFAEVDGVRKYVRKIHYTAKKGGSVDVRLVYDYSA